MKLEQRAHWIVRSVGERTTDACVALVKLAARGEPVEVIQKTPHTEAFRAVWESGVSSGKEWTVCVDADILSLPEALREVLAEALRTDRRTFVVQSLMVDNLIPIIRASGAHLYRNTYAKTALDLIPAPGAAKRPENHTNIALIKRGGVIRQSATITGIHDFEQDYADLYRKGFVHARKHADVGEKLWKNWQQRAVHDRDLEAALLGVNASRKAGPELILDPNFLQEARQRDLNLHRFEPKPPFRPVPVAWVEERLQTFPIDSEIQPLRFTRWNQTYDIGRTPSLGSRILNKVRWLKRRLF